VIKSALLGDRALFDGLAKSPLSAGDSRLASTTAGAARSRGLVEADERERATMPDGPSSTLATFCACHRQVRGLRAYLHGEAVAVVICAAARLSRRLG